MPFHHRKAVFYWAPPRGATPTTHIVKLPLSLMGGRQADFTTSVDNEWLCLRLLKAYELGVATAHIATFGKQRVLVGERFDRRTAPDGRCLMRLPQEGFCQVEGCSPLRKYENEGGPGLRASFSTLRQSQNAEADIGGAGGIGNFGAGAAIGAAMGAASMAAGAASVALSFTEVAERALGKMALG